MADGTGQKSIKADGRAAILRLVRTPLTFFALLSLEVEGSFGYCLTFRQYPQQLTVMFAGLTAGLFLVIAAIVVAISRRKPAATKPGQEVEVSSERIRKVVQIVLDYKRSADKNGDGLLRVLDAVEATLRGKSVAASVTKAPNV